MEQYRREIEAALQYAGGTHTFVDIVEGVASGSMQAWNGPQSIVITEIIKYPRKLVLSLFLAGGRMDELEKMEPLILEWGKAQGCSDAVFIGRRGWERTFLTTRGWTNSQLVVLEKGL